MLIQFIAGKKWLLFGSELISSTVRHWYLNMYISGVNNYQLLRNDFCFQNSTTLFRPIRAESGSQDFETFVIGEFVQFIENDPFLSGNNVQNRRFRRDSVVFSWDIAEKNIMFELVAPLLSATSFCCTTLTWIMNYMYSYILFKITNFQYRS